MNMTIDVEDYEDLQEQYPMERTHLPGIVPFEPFPDLVEHERFARGIEERTYALQGYVGIIRAACDEARKNCRANGGTNRLFIYVNRWGVRCVECTPRIGRVEGVIDVENPDFVKQGWA